MNIDTILSEIRDSCKDVFGENLVGVYVHGSIAFGCFRWDRSDVDFLVVLKDAPSLETKTAFIRDLLELTEHAPPKGLEMSVVLERDCKNFVHPCPFELHFSNSHLERIRADTEGYCREMKGTDPDLAAHLTVTKAVGYPLCGGPVSEVFGDVPREAYLESILFDVESAKEDILRDPVYMTLNLCRVAAYLEDGAVLSKEQGGKWAIGHLPSEYAGLVFHALECYAGGEKPSEDAGALTRFAEYMLSRIGF